MAFSVQHRSEEEVKSRRQTAVEAATKYCLKFWKLRRNPGRDTKKQRQLQRAVDWALEVRLAEEEADNLSMEIAELGQQGKRHCERWVVLFSVWLFPRT